jgi:hypothetical protein
MAAPLAEREFDMESMLEFLVVLPSAVMVAIGAVRGFWNAPAQWRAADEVLVGAGRGMARRRLVLVHDSAREKLLRSPGMKPSRVDCARLRLVYNGG